MRKPRIYLESTIFNHYFDADREAHSATVELFNDILAEKYEAYTSLYVTYELGNADEPKRSNMLTLIGKHNIIVLEDEEEVRQLADIYVNEGVIPEKYRYDALHIAAATVNDLEYVFSLNFRHINKVKTKSMTSHINIREGYRPITIASPMEVKNMSEMNRCEAEIDTIRLKIHEETKHLTREEQIKQINDKGRELAVQYGFKILQSANVTRESGARAK